MTGGEPPALQVQVRPGGGVQATATFSIDAPPAVVWAILTDYAGWPNLFGVPLRVARIERRAGGVLTDLYLRHTLWLGERRLLCETKELPGGRLVTALVGGDFKEYRRSWTLVPDKGGGGTHAAFELIVALDTWAPAWLLAFETRRQLEVHFRILRAQAAARRPR